MLSPPEPADQRTEDQPDLGRERDLGGHADEDPERQADHRAERDRDSDADAAHALNLSDRIVAAARLRPRVRHRDRVDSGALWRVAVSARWRGSDPARRARWFSSSPAWSWFCSRARCCSAAVEIGLGVDDYVHALRFDQWLDSGWYVPEYLLSAGEPDPSRIEATPFVYGAAFNVLAHLLNAVLGIESIGEISTEADAYAVRHLTTALIGLATVLCVGGAVWTLTRDRLAAVWGAAALLAIPVWTGYAMFSNKDVPVAAAFTFVTFGLVLLLSWTDRRPARFAAAATSAAALVAFGVFLGVGTRPAIWVPLLASLATFALLSWRSLGSIRAAARAWRPRRSPSLSASSAPWRCIRARPVTRSSGCSSRFRSRASTGARA